MNLKARATALDQLIDSRPSSPAQFATAGQGLGIRLNGLGNGLCWLQMACTTSSPLSAVNDFAFAGGVEGSWLTMGDTILYVALRSNLIQIVIGNNASVTVLILRLCSVIGTRILNGISRFRM